jgi:hypothetical protein
MVKSKIANLPPDIPLSLPIFSSPISDTKVEDFKRLDYGISSRLGIGWDLGRNLKVTINAFGNWGLADLPKTASLSSIIPYNKDKTQTFGLQFGAFYNL